MWSIKEILPYRLYLFTNLLKITVHQFQKFQWIAKFCLNCPKDKNSKIINFCDNSFRTPFLIISKMNCLFQPKRYQ